MHHSGDGIGLFFSRFIELYAPTVENPTHLVSYIQVSIYRLGGLHHIHIATSMSVGMGYPAKEFIKMNL